MVEALAGLWIFGYLAMGVGVVAAIVYAVMRWLVPGAKPMWFEYKRNLGFTRVEFMERSVDEITGTDWAKRETEISDFGTSSGCLGLLLFIPLHLFVSPVAYILLDGRKRHLRRRIAAMTNDQYALISTENREWLGV